jgi:S-adenosyl-L-methionine-dependent methyltransferase
MVICYATKSMSNQQVNHKYESVRTEDGSFSLRRVGDQPSETMHHPKGAFEETCWVYGPCIQWSLARTGHILSVGLGVGYVEFLAIGMAIAQQKTLHLTSLESDPNLSAFLRSYALGVVSEVPAFIWEIYDQSVHRIADKLNISPVDMKHKISSMIQSGEWMLLGAYNPKTPCEFGNQLAEKSIDGICFDLFSSNTDPELWDEEGLAQFIDFVSARESCLSTYSSKGTLKRALLRNGFRPEIKSGFHKRDSIWAERP